MSYEVKGVPTKITATSRCAIKIRDNYYTIELSEERKLPESDVDISKEYEALFNSVNDEVDHQMQEILSVFNK
jgi:hypothetical protein